MEGDAADAAAERAALKKEIRRAWRLALRLDAEVQTFTVGVCDEHGELLMKVRLASLLQLRSFARRLEQHGFLPRSGRNLQPASDCDVLLHRARSS